MRSECGTVTTCAQSSGDNSSRTQSQPLKALAVSPGLLTARRGQQEMVTPLYNGNPRDTAESKAGGAPTTAAASGHSQHHEAGQVLEGIVGDAADAVQGQGHGLQGAQVAEGADGDLGERVVVQPQVAEGGQPLEAPVRDQGDEVGIQAPAGGDRESLGQAAAPAPQPGSSGPGPLHSSPRPFMPRVPVADPVLVHSPGPQRPSCPGSPSAPRLPRSEDAGSQPRPLRGQAGKQRWAPTDLGRAPPADAAKERPSQSRRPVPGTWPQRPCSPAPLFPSTPAPGLPRTPAPQNPCSPGSWPPGPLPPGLRGQLSDGAPCLAAAYGGCWILDRQTE